MLCEVGSEKDLNKEWIAERKIDGVRCLAFCQNGSVVLRGRNGTDYSNKFPEIVEELSRMEMLNGVFDGEIVCNTFNNTISRVHNQNTLKAKLLRNQYPATFWVFDVIENKPLLERKEMLKGWNGEFVKVLEYTTDLKTIWNTALNEKWEGIIIKNPKSMYENKRSANWLKIKCNKFKDIDFNHYEINPAGIRIDNGSIFVQVTGSQHTAVKTQIDQTGSANCEIKYLEEFDSGKLRMPTFVKLNNE